MNPHQFHIEHGRLQSAALERDAARRHELPTEPRRRIRFHNPLAGRVHFRHHRVPAAPRAV
jgi:hypothetical protein